MNINKIYCWSISSFLHNHGTVISAKCAITVVNIQINRKLTQKLFLVVHLKGKTGIIRTLWSETCFASCLGKLLDEPLTSCILHSTGVNTAHPSLPLGNTTGAQGGVYLKSTALEPCGWTTPPKPAESNAEAAAPPLRSAARPCEPIVRV